MTILDLVTCLGGGQRVIILVTLATMNHIQKLWKVKLDSLTIELICLWNMVGAIVGCIMEKLEEHIILILCKLKRFFPLGFF